jgi:hypothetical protein
MGNIRLYGSTSGYTELAPPAVAPDGVLSLPSGVGTLLTAEGGKVLQVVSGSSSTQLETTSATYVDSGLTATITPTSASSKILVMVSMPTLVYVNSGAFASGGFQLLRAATSIATSVSAMRAGSSELELIGNETFLVLDEPATTSATIYKVQGRLNNGSLIRMQSSNHLATITLIEVSA